MHCESIGKRTPCGHGGGTFPRQVQITAISTNPRKSGKNKTKTSFLPPANEVWGKVIFLHLSVILFTGGSASVHAGIPPPTKHPSDQASPLD